MAGTLAEIARHTLRGEFRRFDPRNARVVLVEGMVRVLPAYTADLSERARAQLEQLGVTVWLGRRVTDMDAPGSAARRSTAARGRPTMPFRYRQFGQLATIGRSKAVAMFGKVHIWRWLAWVTWLSAHIFFLIGFRNR